MPRVGSSGLKTHRAFSGLFGPPRVASDRPGSPPLGSARLRSRRVASDRIGSPAIASARIECWHVKYSALKVGDPPFSLSVNLRFGVCTCTRLCLQNGRTHVLSRVASMLVCVHETLFGRQVGRPLHALPRDASILGGHTSLVPSHHRSLPPSYPHLIPPLPRPSISSFGKPQISGGLLGKYPFLRMGDPSMFSLGEPQARCVYMYKILSSRWATPHVLSCQASLFLYAHENLFGRQIGRPLHALSWETSILNGPPSIAPKPLPLLPRPLPPSSPLPPRPTNPSMVEFCVCLHTHCFNWAPFRAPFWIKKI